jgi:hypothetical protein
MTEKPEGKENQKEEKQENNVKCSFCGNDSFCDQCQMDASKGENMEHCCYDCYQGMKGVLPENVKEKTHVCIPPEKVAESFQNFINDMTARAFMELWNAEKKKLKEMSRQELAQVSFFEGARFMFDFMQRMSQQEQQANEKAHHHEGEHAHEHKHTHEEKK